MKKLLTMIHHPSSIIHHPSNKVLLYFGAVNYNCHVYVNGKKAGHHVGGFTTEHPRTETQKDLHYRCQRLSEFTIL